MGKIWFEAAFAFSKAIYCKSICFSLILSTSLFLILSTSLGNVKCGRHLAFHKKFNSKAFVHGNI